MLCHATITRRFRKPSRLTSRSVSANRNRRKRSSSPRGTSLWLVPSNPPNINLQSLSISRARNRLASERRNKMSKYVLLLRDDHAGFTDASPEEIQKIMQKYTAWRASLQSRIIAGNKLKDGE